MGVGGMFMSLFIAVEPVGG